MRLYSPGLLDKMASNVVEKKRRYEGHELLDEFLLNQVAKEVNVFKLSLFAKDLGIL